MKFVFTSVVLINFFQWEFVYARVALTNFLFFRMSRQDIKLDASSFHRKTRKLDGADASRISSLLTDAQFNLEPLPPVESIPSLMNIVCGQKHKGHDTSTGSSCYIYCLNKCDASEYAPPIPDQKEDSHFFQGSNLPGNSSILDHVCTVVENQEKLVGGGSYHNFLKDTLSSLKSHRQVSAETSPQVQTVIFGDSAASEVKVFLGTFNEAIKQNSSHKDGHIPFEFYQFGVEYLEMKTGYSPRVTYSCKGKEISKTLPMQRIPGRIHLSLWDKRWDIIIPWKYSVMDQDGFSADFYLSTQKHTLDIWHQLFSKLSGIGVGLDIESHLQNINQLLDHAYSFLNCRGPVTVQWLDLKLLLALVGAVNVPIDLSILTWLFTGGLHQSQQPILAGHGKWSDKNGLPLFLNVYLQSKGHAVLNIAIICYIAILITWFPTPGVAAITTGKNPEKFLLWFQRFVSVMMRQTSVTERTLINERSMSHSEMVQSIVCMKDSAVFSADQIVNFIPEWRSPTAGGCLTDIQAISHVVHNILPTLKDRKIPFAIRLEDLRNTMFCALGMLHPGGWKISRPFFNQLGVNFDDLIIPLMSIKDATGISSITDLTTTFMEACREIKIIHLSKDPGHKVHTLTDTEVAVLYTWTYPKHVGKLYVKAMEDDSHDPGSLMSCRELLVVQPILHAVLGVSPPDFTNVNILRTEHYRDKSTRRYAHYTKILEESEDQSLKRKAKGELRKACKSQKVNELEMKARVQQVQDDQARKLKEGEDEEERIIRYLDSDSDSDSGDIEITPQFVDEMLDSSVTYSPSHPMD